MINWRITATTIICNGTGEEVTVMVYKDGIIKCTGERPTNSPGKSMHKPCSAAACPQITTYRDKLAAEENRE